MELHELPHIDSSAPKDHANWVRFEYTEGLLLRALGNGEIAVICTDGMVVPKEYWLEHPDGFGWDWEISVVRWPIGSLARRVFAARILEAKFDDWMVQQEPKIVQAEIPMSPKLQARLRLRAMVQAGPKPKARDLIMAELQDKIPGLSVRAFKSAWDAETTDSWSRSGRPRKK